MRVATALVAKPYTESSRATPAGEVAHEVSTSAPAVTRLIDNNAPTTVGMWQEVGREGFLQFKFGMEGTRRGNLHREKGRGS